MNEITDLESSLHREKRSHAETRSKLLKLEHQVAEERESSRREIVCRATMTSPTAPTSTSTPSVANFDEVAAERECANVTIATLEDQVKILNQKLEEVRTEAESQLEVVQGRCERQEVELLETRAHCKALRTEILELTQRADSISDEKNSYRSEFRTLFNLDSSQVLWRSIVT